MLKTGLQKFAAQMVYAVFLLPLLQTAAPDIPPAAIASNAKVSLEFGSNTRTRVVAQLEGRQITLGPYSLYETITVHGKLLTDFRIHEPQLRPTWGSRYSRFPPAELSRHELRRLRWWHAGH